MNKKLEKGIKEEQKLIKSETEILTDSEVRPIENFDTEKGFGDKFTIEIPPDFFRERGNVKSESLNQEIVFKIRELFLSSDTGKEYAWIPYAIEAGIRFSRGSVILSIEINPETKSVVIGTPEGQINTDIDALQEFSIELMLKKSEEREPIPEIEYSPEMQDAISKISPEAKFKWDLISKAAFQQSIGNNKTNLGEFSVRGVVSDLMLQFREGIGVFSDRVELFSLAKLTYEDVPLTEYEKNILDKARKIYKIAEISPQIGELLDLMHAITLDLRDSDKDRNKGERSGFWSKLKKVLNLDEEEITSQEFQKISREFMDNDLSRMELERKIEDEVYKAKSIFAEDHPFELVKLSDELEEQLKGMAENVLRLIEMVSILMQKRKDKLIPLLEEAYSKRKEKFPHFNEKEISPTITRLDRLSHMAIDLEAIKKITQ